MEAVAKKTINKKNPKLIKKIPKILFRVFFVKLPFRIYRIILYVVAIGLLLYIPWMIGWVIYTEVKAKKTRYKLDEEVKSTIALNKQVKIDEKIAFYKNQIDALRKKSSELILNSKKEFFRYQLWRQQARLARAIALEYEIFNKKLQSVDLKHYFVVENFKNKFIK